VAEAPMSHPKQDDDCPADLIPTRGSLLGRLKDWRDDESWRVFFDTYWKLIYNFALHRGLTHDEAQEVVQETVVSVAKSIAGFEYNPQKCSFKSWLLTVTRSKIANQQARRVRHAHVTSLSTDETKGTVLLNRIPDPSGAEWNRSWDEEWQKNLMDTAIARVKKRVSIEQYQMFDLYVLKQWPARDVSKTLGVSVAHVYVAKHRISKLIRKETKALEARGM
jgi:RNA polymerase sigma-70 factor (ECF subfamily)